jgi:hypothetical protein
MPKYDVAIKENKLWLLRFSLGGWKMLDALMRVVNAFISSVRPSSLGCLAWIGALLSGLIIAVVNYTMPEITDFLRTPERVVANRAAAQYKDVTTSTDALVNTNGGLIQKLVDLEETERQYAGIIADKLKNGEVPDISGIVGYHNAVAAFRKIIDNTKTKTYEIARTYNLDGLYAHDPRARASSQKGLEQYFQVLDDNSRNIENCIAERPNPNMRNDSTTVKYSDIRCEVLYGTDRHGTFFLLSDRLTFLNECTTALRDYINTTVRGVQNSSREIADRAADRADNVPLFSFRTMIRRFGHKRGAPENPRVERPDRLPLYQKCIQTDSAMTYVVDSPALVGTYPLPLTALATTAENNTENNTENIPPNPVESPSGLY